MPEFSINGEDWRPVSSEEIVRLIDNQDARGWLRFPICNNRRFSLASARDAWRLGEPGTPLVLVLLKMLPGGE